MTETLCIPEENLEDVIAILRVGLDRVKVSKNTSHNLWKWIKEEEEYLQRLKDAS